MRADSRISKRLDQGLRTPKSDFVAVAGLLPLPFEGANHFGHLVTEVSGLYYSLLLLKEQIGLSVPVYVSAEMWSKSQVIHPIVTSLFEVRVLSKNASVVRVGTLYVPRPTMINRHSVSLSHNKSVRKLVSHLSHLSDLALPAASKLSPSSKLYLSRSALPSGSFRRLVNEVSIEASLKERGWSIIYPEKLSLPDQIRAFADAKIIAGSLGSALHLLMYFSNEEVKDKIIRCFGHSRIHFLNYILQFKAQALNAEYALCLKEHDANSKPSIKADLVLPEESLAGLVAWLDK